MIKKKKKNRDSILGTVVVVERMSRAERLIRKKYMGLWRLGSATTDTRISSFPTRMSRENKRKIKKTRRKRDSSRQGMPTR